MRCLLMLFLSVVCLNCSNDDDHSDTPLSGLQGKWNLVNITGGFIGVNQDFEKGVIVWDFNDSTKMVTVTNNAVTTGGIYTGLESGTYPYSISAPMDSDELYVNDVSLGIYILESDKFTLNAQYKDGYKLSLER